ncbi:ABC transporter substrate-binding protein [Streptomyces cavernicola]|uniref:Sugar ABC transporter substrate-binding protein n=1 Tax=Streptomyces cavernicola TaxID=3043613 RepID=A0ABT6S7Y1_9ACTN|nr:sugar ABC transporter substrate-binding protein [Streptomyces sp. B-S-A6]MDI3404210.1 sugar ABC transporter substrate-binding protein [Streptomyces sp. B-S-A6]
MTLTWQMWASGADEEKQLKQLAALVHKKHPNIRIDLNTAPFKDYFTKLQTQAAGGEQPCLVSMQSLRLPGFAELMEPLDAHVKKAGTEGFEPAATEALQYEGKTYALPMDLAAMVVYYNKDAFAKAGVPEPKAGWKVADFEKAAKSLTGQGKKGFGLSFSDLHSLTMALTYNGARPVTKDGKPQLDDPRMVEAYDWYAGLATKAKSASVPASSSDGGWAETQFVNGNTAMAVDGTWNLGSHIGEAKFKVGVAPIPAGPDGSKTYVANSGFGMSKSCAYKDEAAKALAVLTGPEAQQSLAEQGRVFPARTDAQPAYEKFLTEQNGSDPESAETVELGMKAVMDGLAGGEPFVGTENWDQVNTLFSQYLLEAYTGSKSAKESLTTIQQKSAG